jgi:hypothetical protein
MATTMPTTVSVVRNLCRKAFLTTSRGTNTGEGRGRKSTIDHGLDICQQGRDTKGGKFTTSACNRPCLRPLALDHGMVIAVAWQTCSRKNITHLISGH